MIDYVQIVGLTGMTVILIAYAMNLSHKMGVDDRSYLTLNIFGSLILIYYATLVTPIAWAFVGLNTVWASAALWKLFPR